MPNRILISWVAWYTDYDRNPDIQIAKTGPNYSLHQTYYDSSRHLKHLLLSSGDTGEVRSALLLQKLKKDFPSHEIELHYMDLSDPLDFQEIKAMAMEALRPYQSHPLDVLISTGTTPMRMSWLLLKLEKNGLNIQMVQSLDPLLSPTHEAKCIDIELATSDIAYRLEVVRQEDAKEGTEPILFKNEAIRKVYEQARHIALHPDASGLIGGPSGSGKELLARYIHEQSARRHAPFVAINCAGLGQDLLESRLFGYRKNAFTGALEDRRGFFEDAQGGTLFLDEIGDMPLYVQQALLRVLENKSIQRVGDSKERKVNVRILAASNKDLWTLCEQGKFREDLFFRLAEVELQLPSWNTFSKMDRENCLRQMISLQAKQMGRKPLQPTEELMAWFCAYDFTGNFREIRQLLRRLYILCPHEQPDLSLLPSRYGSQSKANLSLQHMREIHIRKVWNYCDHNISRTSQCLGIAINTLKSDLIKYGLRET